MFINLLFYFLKNLNSVASELHGIKRAFIFILRKGFHIESWPQTCCVAENELKLLILPPKCWGSRHRHVPAEGAGMNLGLNAHKASILLTEHS